MLRLCGIHNVITHFRRRGLRPRAQILTESTLYAIYCKTAEYCKDTSNHGVQMRHDLLYSLGEEFPEGSPVAMSLVAMGWETPDFSALDFDASVALLINKRFGADVSTKTNMFKSEDAVVYGVDGMSAYGGPYLEPEPLVFTEEDVQRVLYLTQLIAKPRVGEPELVPKVRDVLTVGPLPHP